MTIDASSRNLLPRAASGGAVLVGAFLLLGAWGHTSAVWPATTGAGPSLAMLLPGLLLGAIGLANITLAWPVWQGSRHALSAALAVNGLLLCYLGYLLQRNVAEHPIVEFTGTVASLFLALLAVRLGLRWPA